MSAPFGQAPTFVEYQAWACNEKKCKITSGYMHGPGGMFSTITMTNPQSGKWVVAVDIRNDERLTPSQVAYFDRRLGLKSDFPSADWLNGDV